ncbi:MAG: hypothetical protein ABW026_16555, partial [Microvirga sp.]
MDPIEIDDDGRHGRQEEGGRNMQSQKQQGNHREEAGNDDPDADHQKAALSSLGRMPCVSIS